VSRKRYLIEVRGSDLPPAELPRSGMLVIGSSPEKAGFCVDGQGVAGVHCAIGRTKDGGFAIKDLGSEFGTLLNGERVTQARLKEGDDILVGSMRLRVVAAGADADAPEAAPAEPAAPQSAPKAREPSKSPPAHKTSKTKLPRIPGYQVHQRLGRGATGDVFLAVQESLDREVALKVLSQKHEADAAFVQSFQAEARSAAALNHPNVVTVHDVGEAGGVHYLTMEYMDRGSLEARVAKEGALPWPIVLGVLKDAASGLVYAESRGIVHRDIKPANLMQNHTGVTKIADLGLATNISQEDAPDGERKIFGTPHFISPEQIKGEKADCRSDLYALGSTAYRLLTGRTPFEGTSTREILRAKLRGESTPVRELATDVPEALARIVERLMELEPAERFPSASALLREVEAVQSGPAPGAAAAGGSPAVRRLLVPGLLAVAAILAAVFFLGGEPADELSAGGGPGPATAGSEVPSPFRELDDPQEAPPTPNELASETADDDIEEKLFETAAENALLRLAQRDLSPAERRDALREMAREYLGTTAATRAIEEAESIDEAIATAARQAAERDERLGGVLTAMREAAGLDDPALRPGHALRAMAAVEGLEALENDDAFRAERAKLEALVLSTALEQFTAVQTTMDEQRQSGDFDALRTTATDLLNRCDLPVFEEGQAPEGSERFASLAAELRELIDSIPQLELAHEREVADADRRRVAQGLAGAKGISAELARLDFGAAAERCGAFAEEVRSPGTRAWSEGLEARLREASRAIPLLVEEFDRWRRHKIDDPEDAAGRACDVRAATAEGLVVDDRSGERRIPWSAFGGRTEALDTLFSRRLERNYTQEERSSIGALMHFSALAEALAQVSEMFRPEGGAVFTEREAEDLPEAFVVAAEWIDGGPEREAFERDRRAVELLGAALVAGSDDQWTTAVSRLESLLIELPDSLLVRLLSDGSADELAR